MEVTDRLKEARRVVKTLETQREEKDDDWKKIREYILPHRGQWPADGETNQAETKKGKRILNPSATQSVRRAAGGLTSAMTPSTQKWFSFSQDREELNEATGVRWYHDQCSDLVGRLLQMGMFYQAIHTCNQEYFGFGAFLLYMESDIAQSLVRFECVTCGTYYLQFDHMGSLNTVVRRMRFTAQQLAEKYGEEKLCDSTRKKLRDNPYDYVDVVHVVRPRKNRNPQYIDQMNMPFESIVYEDSIAAEVKDVLNISGYNEMPFFYAGFDKAGDAVYAVGPGHLAIGLAMGLQEMERQKLIAIQKLVDPPLKKPAGMKGQTVNTSPGGETAVATNEPQGLSALYEVQIRLNELYSEIEKTELQLASILHADLFYDLPADMRPADMTASEYMSRKRERLQQVAPAVSAYEPDVLDKMIERAYAILDRFNMLPDAPPALRSGGVMNVHYESIVAQSLRQTDTETTLAFLDSVNSIAQMQMGANREPDVLDRVNFDQVVDEVANGSGAPARILRSDEETQAIRRSKAEANAQAQDAQSAAMLASQIAQIGSAPTGPNTVAGDMLGKG